MVEFEDEEDYDQYGVNWCIKFLKSDSKIVNLKEFGINKDPRLRLSPLRIIILFAWYWTSIKHGKHYRTGTIQNATSSI